MDAAVKMALDAYILSLSSSSSTTTTTANSNSNSNTIQFQEMQQRAFDSEQALLEIGDELEAKEKEVSYHYYHYHHYNHSS